MDGNSWVRGPVGIDAERRITRTGFHTALVMVPTMTAGTRLMDLVPLLEADHRVQVVFTVPHAAESWSGVEDFVRDCGGVLYPWQQALQHRWDLVLTASHRHIEQVHGRVMVLPHGAGALMSRRFSKKAGADRPSTGLDRELLTSRGRLLPSALALTHEGELGALRGSCPEALPVAFVAGDLCLDRMLAGLPLRAVYRRALGVSPEHTLVTISSTWSAEGVFGRHLELYERLVEELPAARFRVAAVIHPQVWTVHGRRQVQAWLGRAIRGGLLVIPPHEGWRATMVASDRVIGDHGSTTSYAAAIGRPVHLAAFPRQNIRPGSLADALAGIAPRLDHDRPLAEQLHRVPGTDQVPEFARLISAAPGQAAQRFRAAMYRLLSLTEPAWPARSAPVPLPQLCPQPQATARPQATAQPAAHTILKGRP